MTKISRRAFLGGSSAVVAGAMTPGAVAFFCKYFDSKRWWDFGGLTPEDRFVWVKLDPCAYPAIGYVIDEPGGVVHRGRPFVLPRGVSRCRAGDWLGPMPGWDKHWAATLD